MDIGNGTGFWNTMPILLRSLFSEYVGVEDVLAIEDDLALGAHLG